MMHKCALTGRVLGTAERQVVIMAATRRSGADWELVEVGRAGESVFFTMMSLRVGLRRHEVPGLEKTDLRHEMRFSLSTYVERLIARHPEKIEALREAMPFLTLPLNGPVAQFAYPSKMTRTM